MRYVQDEAIEKYPTITEVGTDHKAWAKRIVYRDEKGDKTLLHVQVKFAREALGLGEKSKT